MAQYIQMALNHSNAHVAWHSWCEVSGIQQLLLSVEVKGGWGGAVAWLTEERCHGHYTTHKFTVICMKRS